MNPQQLECFTTLAKTLNYAKTAEQLSLSQPAVLVLGIKDAKFTAEDIAFQKLHDDAFVCVMRKNHPLAQACKKRRRKSVSSKDMWPYRQQSGMDKNSAIYKFITLARECTKEAMPCHKQ